MTVAPSAIAALDTLELHLRCLYAHDARGRILRTREPGGGPAPRFHLGRTRLGNLWRFRADLADSDVRALARLAGREEPLVGGAVAPGARVSRPPPPERMEPFRRALRERAAIRIEWSGPAYAFPDIAAVVAASERHAAAGPPVIAVDRTNESVLEQHFPDEIAELELRQPCFAVVDAGSAVSLCYAARPLESPSGNFESCAASEAGVVTVEGHRGRGCAPRVVAAWAAAVAARGGLPLYSTSWKNRASRAVAQKLGLVWYAEDVHLT